MPPFLIVQRGPVIGRRYDLTASQYTIGRGPDNDLVLDDALVSRYHAVIRQESAGAVIIDLGSTNPVLVNDEPLEPGVPQRLQHRDVVVIGAAVLSFQSPATAGRPPAAGAPAGPRTIVASRPAESGRSHPAPGAAVGVGAPSPALPEEAPVQPPPTGYSALPALGGWPAEPPPLVPMPPVASAAPLPPVGPDAIGTAGSRHPDLAPPSPPPASRPAEPLPDDETPTVIRHRLPDE